MLRRLLRINRFANLVVVNYLSTTRLEFSSLFLCFSVNEPWKPDGDLIFSCLLLVQGAFITKSVVMRDGLEATGLAWRRGVTTYGTYYELRNN